jgi:hypothetical protein
MHPSSLLLIAALPRLATVSRGSFAPRGRCWNQGRSVVTTLARVGSSSDQEVRSGLLPRGGGPDRSRTATADARTGRRGENGGYDLGLRLTSAPWHGGLGVALRPGGESRYLNAGAPAHAPLPCARCQARSAAIPTNVLRHRSVYCLAASGGETPHFNERSTLSEQRPKESIYVAHRAGAVTPARNQEIPQ